MNIFTSKTVSICTLALITGCSIQTPRTPSATTTNSLHPFEVYSGGSQQAELDMFEKQMNQVASVQTQLQKNHTLKEKSRVFHEKQHGCLIGSLELLSERPQDAKHETFEGLFSLQDKKSYTVLARFSNGVGYSQHDLLPDVKGAAIKIFNVQDSTTDKIKNIDLTMTNSPTAFGKDQAEFIEFMEANINSGFLKNKFAKFLIDHPAIGRGLIKASLPILSVTQQRYWSGHPYLLKPNLAMKFNIRPLKTDLNKNIETEEVKNILQAQKKVEESTYKSEAYSLDDQINNLLGLQKYNEKTNPISEFLKIVHTDYLTKDLAKRASEKEIQFELSLQIEKSSTTTPIEDNLKPWKEEDSPSIPVGIITFHKQNIDTQEMNSLCQNTRFTPGHFVSQHRPLSNMGRGRIYTYQRSQEGRKANATDITEEDVLKLINK